jgi:hypothetical protein
MGSGGSKDACNAIDCGSIYEEKYNNLVKENKKYIQKCCKNEKFTINNRKDNINKYINIDIKLIVIIIILIFSIFLLCRMR